MTVFTSYFCSNIFGFGDLTRVDKEYTVFWKFRTKKRQKADNIGQLLKTPLLCDLQKLLYFFHSNPKIKYNSSDLELSLSLSNGHGGSWFTKLRTREEAWGTSTSKLHSQWERSKMNSLSLPVLIPKSQSKMLRIRVGLFVASLSSDASWLCYWAWPSSSLLSFGYRPFFTTEIRQIWIWILSFEVCLAHPFSIGLFFWVSTLLYCPDLRQKLSVWTMIYINTE